MGCSDIKSARFRHNRRLFLAFIETFSYEPAYVKCDNNFRGILYEEGDWKTKLAKPSQTRKPKREKFELGKQNMYYP
jgi:hypothetical protein